MHTPELADGESSSSSSSNNTSVIPTSASRLLLSEPSKVYLCLQKEKANQRTDCYHSHENPSSHWKWVLKTIAAPHGGSVKKMNSLMEGIWKEIQRDPSPNMGDDNGAKAEVEGL
ncbi:hypothetical protein K435DRAFT_966338 [Dendrothele bispora CBS 962.96]|uniref:Uncharacterized protein n=1 Tax=Dendrothele bispora (strain CBS 962.96) TaxID=1314807 RepID=A0A4S8M0P2_DENBC|nr:hypothetical protein K435DRAFT_966338 [Dendrothele bispora CBS 962.96]